MGRPVQIIMTARALADQLGAQLIGSGEQPIDGVSSLKDATANDLSFFSDDKHRADAMTSLAGVLILRPEHQQDVMHAAARIVHPQPHLAFAKALDLLFPMAAAQPGAHSSAFVDALASVTGVEIGAKAVIEAGVTIGAGSIIGAGAIIQKGAQLGALCTVHANATIGPSVILGDRCVIHQGAVIGAEGFGFQPTSAGWVRVQQVGLVRIGNDVEIGANTTVDRGAIGDTVIHEGVKIDNQVQIAHNVVIGAHTAIAACVGIAGSVTVGARCMLGGAAMVNGHLSICDDVVVSGGTLIASSVTTPGRYTSVFPFTPHQTWVKIAAKLRRSGNK